MTKRGFQRIHDHLAVDLPLIDLTEKPEAERKAEFRTLLDDDAAIPFDLEAGPLVRATLVRLTSDQHALVFTAHHIVCDGWSTNVLLDNLGKLYEAARRGLPAALPPAARYLDYVAHQEQWVQSPDYAAVESYWVNQFAKPVPPLDLPTDRPRGSVKSSRGDTVRHTIDQTTYKEIRRFGSQQGCTLFATLLAGFEILIHRLSSQSDFAVGIPFAGQAKLDGEPLVGHCVNFLPLRCTFDSDTTVGQTLIQAKARLLDAYENQDYTFGTLVRKLNIPRDPSRLPLTEVQFNVERLGSRLQIPGLEAQVDPNPKRFVNFDLFLNVVESEDGLVIDCDYNSDLYDRETVARWLGHYAVLLVGMVGRTDRPVSEISLLDDAERHRLLVEWNATQFAYPRETPLATLIEQQVEKTPNAIAVIMGDQSITYAELNRQANRLARELVKHRIGPDSLVVIHLERSINMMVALLATIKAGAGYLPLDTLQPSQRLQHILNDSGAMMILTQKDLRGSLPESSAVVVEVDNPVWNDQPSDNFEIAVGPTNIGYVIYTSGSTGKPKGVIVPRGALTNLLYSVRSLLQVDSNDRFLAVTTISFDIASADVWLPLLIGARVVLASREQAGDGVALRQLIDQHDITFLQATPVTWQLLLQAGWHGKSNLRVVCTGEAMPREVAVALPPIVNQVWNLYGPTETTIWSTGCRIFGNEEKVLIGRPLGNTQCYILDENRRLVPPGSIGELFIAGDGVACSYLNQPSLTAERFLFDPFAAKSDARMFRTGDLARYLSDGSIECLGRKDHQVKIRGYRIELGEIEASLVSHPRVEQAIVVERDSQLVAYCVFSKNDPAQKNELRDHLRQWLPEYMIPQLFMKLPALPLTPNGKVDRLALPKPDGDVAVMSRGKQKPHTPNEQTLAVICESVLKHDTIFADDNLFDLGADSLRLFQIVSRAKDAGMNLTMKQILKCQTVAAICAELGNVESTGVSEGVAIMPVKRESYRFKPPAVHMPGNLKRS